MQFGGSLRRHEIAIDGDHFKRVFADGKVFITGLIFPCVLPFLIEALKNITVAAGKAFGFRQGLVVCQFGLAAMLIVGIIVVQKQLNYIQDVNLGFDKDQIIIIPDAWQLPRRDSGSTIRHSLAQLPGVLKVGAGRELGALPDGGNHRMSAKGGVKEIDFTLMDIDHNYLDVLSIELKEGRGGQMARSAGSSAQLVAKEGDYAQIRLPSSEVRLVRLACYATIGQVGNVDHGNVKLGKAGRKRHMGIRPTVRGSAMSPRDHPHGGGEGRSGIGMPSPKSPWGKPTLGKKTRRNKSTDKYIIRRRKKKRR